MTIIEEAERFIDATVSWAVSMEIVTPDDLKKMDRTASAVKWLRRKDVDCIQESEDTVVLMLMCLVGICDSSGDDLVPRDAIANFVKCKMVFSSNQSDFWNEWIKNSCLKSDGTDCCRKGITFMRI